MKTTANPFNYTGSKHRYINDMKHLLPKSDGLKILDPFVGGGDLISKLNKTWSITASDKNEKLIEMHKMIQRGVTSGDIIEVIEKFGLSRDDKEAFLSFREHYNNGNQTPENLYALLCHAFSNYLHFNNKGEFHTHFGRRTFNSNMIKKYDNYQRVLSEIDVNFLNVDCFNFDFSEYDLLLIDPPYLHTAATYNLKRGWRKQQDVGLLRKIDESGAKFIYFNQLVSNDIENEHLIEWSKKYSVTELPDTTSNCASTKARGKTNLEVIIHN